MKTTPFYLVWGVNTNAPTRRHESYHSAEKEAKRLANLEGTEFIVLASLKSFRVAKILETDIRPKELTF